VFSGWYQIQQGVFVGTSDRDGNVTSCVGHFEPETTRYKTSSSTALYVYQSASRCVEDWQKRWRKTKSEYFKPYSYTIDVLQAQKEWINVPLLDLNAKTHGHYGIHLQVDGCSATYIPHVWEEHWPYDVQGMITSLYQKATGHSITYEEMIKHPERFNIRVYTSQKHEKKCIFH